MKRISPRQRGKNLEPEAREAYTRASGISMTPICAEHDKYSWLHASLDGWNATHQLPLEIKCPGRRDHEEALSGRVPHKYIPQIQHILLVTGASQLHYWSYDGREGALVVVEADAEYQRRLLEKEIAFWESLLAGLPSGFVGQQRGSSRKQNLRGDLESHMGREHAKSDAIKPQ